jgi:nucleotidyltransferase/DNA polymerase involved in DNA repair
MNSTIFSEPKEITAISNKDLAEKEIALRELQIIPGVGKSIANDLYNIGIRKVSDLRRKNPEKLYQLSNQRVGAIQDRCLLYVFRCAVYFAGTPKPDNEKLNWWWWKDKI